VFGGVGYLMVLAGWPRAPLVLGLVLARSPRTTSISPLRVTTLLGSEDRLVLVLLAIAVGVICYPIIQARRARAKAVRA